MKQQPLKNRRVRPRVDIHLKANFEIDGKTLPSDECLIANISVSGAGLVFPGMQEGALATGDMITLEFSTPGDVQQTYARGRIVWIRQCEDTVEAGVAFSDSLPFDVILQCCGDVKKGFDN